MKEPDFISSILKRVTELDAKYAIDAMGGSESLYEKTLMRMVRQLPLYIGEMDDSLSLDGGLGAFAVKVHGIKGTLRHVGKMRLADKAESLEEAAKTGDKTYCAEHYGFFKEELLRFYAQVNEVAGLETDAGAGAEITNDGNISDYIDTIKQAGEAADSYDSMSAYEILLPLTKTRFGGNTDELVLKAANALDQFMPFEALEYIAELLNECEKPQIS